MNIPITKKLEAFLRKERKLTRFHKNSLDDYYRNESLSSVDSSFIFRDTPEGFLYWWEVSERFNKGSKS